MINLKQLLKENLDQPKKVLEASDHVRSGLEKVFSSGDSEISFHRCENVGLGYIKSISEAFKIAMTESRKIAKNFGYREDNLNAKFIKEDGEISDYDRGEYENGRRMPDSTFKGNNFKTISSENPEDRLTQIHPEEMHDETDMNNPEERREVQIARLIQRYAMEIDDKVDLDELKSKIIELSQELLIMHGIDLEKRM